jgi:prepilin signal peptidase PulO-like enzyme (type II secretory pathway)
VADWVDAARVAAALAALAYAAYTDHKTREVPDEVWWAVGAAAFVLFAVDLHADWGGMAWVMAVPAGLVFVVAVLGGEFLEIIKGEGPIPDDYALNAEETRRRNIDYALTAAALGAAVALFVISPSLDLGARPPLLQGPVVQALMVVLMFGAAYLMFFASLLAGGADAKGLIALAILFPVAPDLPSLPLVQPDPLAVLIVPFALAIFFNGAILLVVAGLPVLPLISLKRGAFKFPESMAGVPKGLDKVNLDREWILGKVKDGAWKRVLWPRHGSASDEMQKEALAFLKARGDRIVYVTPRMPFMVYLVVGFVILLIFSSPLYFVGGL